MNKNGIITWAERVLLERIILYDKGGTMARSSRQKLKILFLLKVFQEETDEDHGLTMTEILSTLEARGVSAERKSIYSDIELLRSCGYEIEMSKEKIPDYRLISRDFELAELKLLVDAVQSSYFITEKKSKQLIEKISSLSSRFQATQLKRQVHILDRPKNFNERVYYHVDKIHTAINSRQMIAFQYLSYDIDKNNKCRRGGEKYERFPLMLCWNDNNYYLVCYSPKHEDIGHFRVDRMDAVEIITGDTKEYQRIDGETDLAKHTNKAFGMFTGKSCRATLRFDESLVNVVIDRFGAKVPFKKLDDDWFEIQVEIFKSPVFFGWMLQFGKQAEIVAPYELREEMCELIEGAQKRYE